MAKLKRSGRRIARDLLLSSTCKCGRAAMVTTHEEDGNGRPKPVHLCAGKFLTGQHG